MGDVTTGVVIGRFQPFHEGHKAVVDEVMSKKDLCLVLIRDGEQSRKNPFSYEEREQMIRESYPDSQCIRIQRIPDPGYDLELFYGRKVGYGITEIRLADETEAISGTQKRKEMGL